MSPITATASETVLTKGTPGSMHSVSKLEGNCGRLGEMATEGLADIAQALNSRLRDNAAVGANAFW